MVNLISNNTDEEQPNPEFLFQSKPKCINSWSLNFMNYEQSHIWKKYGIEDPAIHVKNILVDS